MSSETKEKPARGSSAVITGVIVLIVIVVAAALAYFAWRTIQPTATPINEILSDLRTYDGQLVTVRGKVSSTVNLIFKAFELTDETGTITVVTQRGLPQPGDTVTVQGQVNELFNFNGINKTVILEPAEDARP